MTEHTPKIKRNSKRNSARMNIHTVAQLANVSIATVSRTINHNPTVNLKMAKRVWEVIRELNYLPNTQARALVSGPVSYTHLDVYKRQALEIDFAFELEDVLSGLSEILAVGRRLRCSAQQGNGGGKLATSTL